MTIRKRETHDGGSRLLIDIRYRTADGKQVRYRRDAQIQTMSGARAEERRLLAELGRTGTLQYEKPVVAPESVARSSTFADAVRRFRLMRMPSLKPSTRFGYDSQLDRLLLPRFGDVALEEFRAAMVAELDVELVAAGWGTAARRNVQVPIRAVLKAAVEAGLLADVPRLPPLPKVGRKVVKSLHRDDVDALLAIAPPNARLAFALSAFAGLRGCEVRGLRWPDVDLKGGTLTVRRSISRGAESTPKSGHDRVVPLTTSLLTLLRDAVAGRDSPWAPVALTGYGKPWGETGLNQAFRRCQRRVGLKGLSYHDLRHFFVTELFRRGAPAPAVQRLVGHSDLGTTQRYADMVASDLRGAVLLLEGDRRATD